MPADGPQRRPPIQKDAARHRRGLRLGGLGGVIAEVLARAGVGALKLVDNDKFEPTNLNRQIFCFRDTVGKPKVKVAEAFLKKINPQLKLQTLTQVTEENIDRILKDAGVAALAIDAARPCLVISRAPGASGSAGRRLVIPYGNVRVITRNAVARRSLRLCDHRQRNQDISDEEYQNLKLSMLARMKRSRASKSSIRRGVERIQKGRIPSFAPIVWLTAV
jgi:hypothetical protein